MTLKFPIQKSMPTEPTLHLQPVFYRAQLLLSTDTTGQQLIWCLDKSIFTLENKTEKQRLKDAFSVKSQQAAGHVGLAGAACLHTAFKPFPTHMRVTAERLRANGASVNSSVLISQGWPHRWVRGRA